MISLYEEPVKQRVERRIGRCISPVDGLKEISMKSAQRVKVAIHFAFGAHQFHAQLVSLLLDCSRFYAW
jgi:hypothetical protein